MTRPWQVHLSPEAAAALRDATRSSAARVGKSLDRLALHGRDAVALDDDGPAWTGQLVAGESLLTIAGRDGDPRIIVVRIARMGEHAAHHAVDVLPLRLSTRRTLGSVLQGIDLDLRYTFRALRRAPLFAAVVIATLAVGLGGATALTPAISRCCARAIEVSAKWLQWQAAAFR